MLVTLTTADMKMHYLDLGNMWIVKPKFSINVNTTIKMLTQSRANFQYPPLIVMFI